MSERNDPPAGPAAPLPGAKCGRKPGETAEAFLARVGKGIEAAWREATGTPFPETFPQMFEACGRFPHLAELRVCEWAPVPHTIRAPEGVFSFTVPASGFVTPAEIEELLAAHGIETIEQEGEGWFLWRGRLVVISIPTNDPAPCTSKLKALAELLTAEWEEKVAAFIGPEGIDFETLSLDQARILAERFPRFVRLRLSEVALRGYAYPGLDGRWVLTYPAQEGADA